MARPVYESKPVKLKQMQAAESWVFDLDNTLYPVSANLFDQIDKRMCAYIANFLEVNHAEAYKIQKRYFREYGTSLKGMMDNHQMDPVPYLEYVHEVDLSVIEQDVRMESALKRLQGRKVVFTNAAAIYAEKVLEKLGIAHLFEGIFDIADANFVPKPDPQAYQHLVTRFGIDPQEAVMVEDIARNLRPAADLGMKTVWVITNRPWAHTDAEFANPDFSTNDLPLWLTEVAEL